MTLSLLTITAESSFPATVASLDCPEDFPAGQCLRLSDAASGREFLAQTDPLDQNRLHLPLDGMKAGEIRQFRVVGADDLGGEIRGASVTDTGETVTIDVLGEPFTRYHYLASEAPARPFFHPLLAPGGLSVTRHFPMESIEGERKDHPHHRSLWVAHGDVNGTDNWSEEPGYGRTEHHSFEGIFSGPIAGGFREFTRWVTHGGECLLNETRDVRVYVVDPTLRILDLTLRFAPKEKDVVFGDTKEGGLISVRVATSMDGDKGGTIHNAEGGVGESQTWGKTAAWCDYYGPVQGKMLGIALMDHPSNPRFPTYWHVRDYGLMTANPFGLSHFYNDKSRDGSMTFPAGETTTWRYRLLVHSGTTEEADVASQYAAYVAKLSVSAE